MITLVNLLNYTQENNDEFKNSNKCCICDNDYIDGDFKVRDHCHITGKYGVSAHRDCNIRLNHKILSQPKELWFSSYYARNKLIQY